ncbi:MAG: S1 RNA-binding domain-containing protein [Kiritimatiellia bacterium]
MGDFDFGSLVEDQFKGIRRGYKFGQAFNEDKLIVRPGKPAAAAEPGDNAAIRSAWEAGESVSGVVEREVKGGYEVTVAGQRAFCPFSQIDKFKKDATEYLGRKFDFVVSEYSRDERGLNVVVSRRALIEVQEQALREAMLEQLHEGETLNGTVTRVLDFGAFVDLGGVEGLVPVREVAWDRVDDVGKVLKSGDVVTVKVMRIDREAGRISLSRRECLPRVFRRAPEDAAAAESAAEVAEWMQTNAERNANVGSLAAAFDGLRL